MAKTQKRRGSRVRGWKQEKPGYHQRTVMLRRCGEKCFLGPNKTFPICSKNTCKRNKKGIMAAYMRAKEYITIRPTVRKYKSIAKRAKKML